MEKDVITPRELSEKWNVTKETLCRWRKSDQGPLHFMVGGRVFYKLSEVEACENNWEEVG